MLANNENMLDENDLLNFMKEALLEGEKALSEGEVPVGCVLVDKEKKIVVGRGHNLTNRLCIATAHAEINAFNQLLMEIENRPILDMSNIALFVTCEPCIMCAAAIGELGLKEVYFGCSNDRFGGNGSILSVHEANASLEHLKYKVTSGIMREEAIALFQNFYESENRRAPESKRRKKQ